MSSNSSSSLPAVVEVPIQALQAIQGAVEAERTVLSYSLNSFTLELVLFGAYTLLVIAWVFPLMRNGIKARSKLVLILACIALYVMATCHCALALGSVFRDYENLRVLLAITDDCLEELQSGGTCTIDNHIIESLSLPTTDHCALSAFLALNVVVGDALVLWRVCVLWPGSRVVRTTAIMLVLATLVLSTLSTAHGSCTTYFVSFSTWPLTFPKLSYVYTGMIGSELLDNFGAASIILSWVTNVGATLLISCKAWRHRQIIKHDLQAGNVRTQTEKVVMLFVESGIIYCLLWTTLLLCTFMQWLPESNDMVNRTNWRQFMAAIQTLKSSGLIHLVGMYPTALVVLVAFTRSNYGYTTERDLIPIPDLEPQPVSPHVRRNRASTVIKRKSERISELVLVLEPSENPGVARSEADLDITDGKVGGDLGLYSA